MRRPLQAMVVLGPLAVALLLVPPATSAQDRARFRGMDSNRDGVITRSEWRGNEQSFRRHDANNDGVLTGAEIDASDNLRGDFAAIDLDGNGYVTAQEWRRTSSQLDTNRDGSITRDELSAGPQNDGRWDNQQTEAYLAGRERGRLDGLQAGREDGARRSWDLDGQRELEQADAGYRQQLGSREQYQAGYRDAFRAAYAEAYGPRR